MHKKDTPTSPYLVEVSRGGKKQGSPSKNEGIKSSAHIGGVNVFGGGLPLYDSKGKLLGATGVNGDSSCVDHNIAWKVRHKINLDNVPAGVRPQSVSKTI